jgi:hypothetical protein
MVSEICLKVFLTRVCAWIPRAAKISEQGLKGVYSSWSEERRHRTDNRWRYVEKHNIQLPDEYDQIVS